jgi:hypothetical protein
MNRVMASHQRAGNALADQPREANVSSPYKSMSKCHHSNRLATKYQARRRIAFAEMLEYRRSNTTSVVGILLISIFDATGRICRMLPCVFFVNREVQQL